MTDRQRTMVNLSTYSTGDRRQECEDWEKYIYRQPPWQKKFGIFKYFLNNNQLYIWLEESWIKTVKLYCFVPPAEGLVTVFYIRIISKQKIFDSFICFFQLEDKTTWDVVLWKLRSSILYLNQQIRWISFILLFCSICFLIHLDFFFRWNSRYGMFNIVCWLKIFEAFYL